MVRVGRLVILCLIVYIARPAEARAIEADVLAPGNPHMPKKADPEHCDAGQCECPAQNLVISSANLPARLAVQTESLLKLEQRAVAGIEVDIYHFKQPRRLSELELPFKVLPLRQVELTDIEVMEVSPRQALDSWFPGYAWSILICARCEGTHIGWKFTPTAGGEAFYGLIVETLDKEEEDALAAAEGRLGVLEGLRVVGRPLAALGLAASAVSGLSK
eukprot:gnl/TRDRNA2_/TRDRNA2_42769_c0_seq1.p1 gnl/TRDRNA2_/TRDRNA2_42769_c0~~gnl/TRDRNA2_/TRDRNA2_42769_c0_seq1.p1  ORF type:complete len:218 (+),score=54.89 gnl/TRDRNA2_/TRDRNA2_42769_c0_seq1:43-696(+)